MWVTVLQTQLIIVQRKCAISIGISNGHDYLEAVVKIFDPHGGVTVDVVAREGVWPPFALKDRAEVSRTSRDQG